MEEYSGTQTINASNEKVWAYLLDVKKVAACAPGFQGLEETGRESWRATISASLGIVKPKFVLDLTREMQEPTRMTVKGRGKAPGSAVEISGVMNLNSLSPTQTEMKWTASVSLSGTIAALGARLMSSTVEKLTGQFFTCLKSKLESGG